MGARVWNCLLGDPVNSPLPKIGKELHEAHGLLEYRVCPLRLYLRPGLGAEELSKLTVKSGINREPGAYA